MGINALGFWQGLQRGRQSQEADGAVAHAARPAAPLPGIKSQPAADVYFAGVTPLPANLRVHAITLPNGHPYPLDSKEPITVAQLNQLLRNIRAKQQEGIFRRELNPREQAIVDDSVRIIEQQFEGVFRKAYVKSAAFRYGEETLDGFKNMVWQRLLSAMRQRELTFPGLGAFGSYLHMAARSADVDYIRIKVKQDLIQEHYAVQQGKGHKMSAALFATLPQDQQIQHAVADAVVNAEHQNQMMKWLRKNLKPGEFVILFLSAVYDMPPRDIYNDLKLHELSMDIQDVYKIKRNVLSRLARNPEFQHFLH